MNFSFLQFDLLEDIENSWDFLLNESPQYPDEIQISDINKIAEENQLLITLDFNLNNIKNIIDTFNTSKGIAIVLGDNSTRNDIHNMNYKDALQIIKSIE